MTNGFLLVACVVIFGLIIAALSKALPDVLSFLKLTGGGKIYTAMYVVWIWLVFFLAFAMFVMLT